MSVLDDGANTSYNALLLSLDRRLSRNFSMLLNYTWSHCLSDGDGDPGIGGSYQNPNDRRAEHGNCSTDQRQMFNASVIALSPHFSSPWKRRLFGNWQASGILTKRTGLWFHVIAGRDNSLTALNADRADVVADSHVAERTVSRWFNPAAFRLSPVGTFGNSGRNNVEGPGGLTFDIAVKRGFPITERHRIELRAEAFNVLNHPVYINPRASLADPNIGRILGAQDPRIMQFALKYVF